MLYNLYYITFYIESESGHYKDTNELVNVIIGHLVKNMYINRMKGIHLQSIPRVIMI